MYEKQKWLILFSPRRHISQKHAIYTLNALLNFLDEQSFCYKPTLRETILPLSSDFNQTLIFIDLVLKKDKILPSICTVFLSYDTYGSKIVFINFSFTLIDKKMKRWNTIPFMYFQLSTTQKTIAAKIAQMLLLASVNKSENDKNYF